MLTITKISDSRIDLELNGGLDADGMRAALEDLLAASAEVAYGRMLVRVVDFALPTLGALAVEFQYLPKLFALLTKFDRCAVLSDAAWIRAAAEIEGAVLPGMTIKSFELGDAEAAEAWLKGPGRAGGEGTG